MPKVSVVIPNYNHARYLRQRVESVLRQSYQDFEVILMDDGSTDESREILNEYAGDPRVRMEFNEKNSGSTFKQWNKGVGLARGEYVWIAESDDYADEGLLEKLVGALEAEPKASYAYCRSWQVDPDGQLHGFAGYHLTDFEADRWTRDYCSEGVEECREYFVSHNIVPNASAVVFRKSVYEAVGGADESLRLCGDWKLWAAMALVGKVVYFSDPLNYHRHHVASVRTQSQNLALDVSEGLQVIRWVWERATPPRAAMKRSWANASSYWPSAVLNRAVPAEVRREIFRNVRAIDPYAMFRLILPAMTSVRLKIVKELRAVRRKFGQ